MSPVDSMLQRLTERVTRTVLFVDVVESSRLIEEDEEGTIRSWRSLVDHAESEILPAYSGRLVKSLGDGIMADFNDVRSAVSGAFAIQHASNRGNQGLPPDRQMLLRMAMETCEVIVDRHDVYGRGVMLAARLMTLAGPGEIVVSAHVRDRLTPELDADVEDLGECYLKHLYEPVRAYRIGPPGPRPVLEPGIPIGELLPTIAVIPFTCRDGDLPDRVLGEVLADEVIAALSRSSELNVISRLSTTVFRERKLSFAEISTHLDANYVLSGVYRGDESQLTLEAELAEAKSGRIVWTERIGGSVAGILSGESEIVGRVVSDVSCAVMSREIERVRSQPLPTLKSYTLLMGAIALMHRLSPRDFDEAGHLLQALIDRATRQAVPRAWMAKWHVLRVQQGWSHDPKLDAQLALDNTKHALDTDPDCSLALAVDGFVHTNLLKDFDVAQARYERALEINPNDSLACLLKGTLHAFRGEGEAAVEGTSRALRLSPLDPHRYFYDSLAATAHLAAHDWERALQLAERSLRVNRTHTSTLRALAIAQWYLGREQDARETVATLRELEPTLTIERYLERSPSAGFSTGKEWSHALHEAGMPE